MIGIKNMALRTRIVVIASFVCIGFSVSLEAEHVMMYRDIFPQRQRLGGGVVSTMDPWLTIKLSQHQIYGTCGRFATVRSLYHFTIAPSLRGRTLLENGVKDVLQHRLGLQRGELMNKNDEYSIVHTKQLGLLMLFMSNSNARSCTTRA